MRSLATRVGSLGTTLALLALAPCVLADEPAPSSDKPPAPDATASQSESPSDDLSWAEVAPAPPRYSLDGTKLIVEWQDKRSEHPLPCARTHALVSARYDFDLYVACGDEGIVVFSLLDPLRPRFVWRMPALGGPCVGVTEEGVCLHWRPQTPGEYDALLRALEESRRAALLERRYADAGELERQSAVVREWRRTDTKGPSPAMVGAGIAGVAVGGGAFVAGLFTLLGGALHETCSGAVATFSCKPNPDPAMMTVGTGFMIGGGVVALAGGILWMTGARVVMREQRLSLAPSPQMSISLGPGSVVLVGTF